MDPSTAGPGKPVRRIVIAGGGTAGWMVAAGLSKSLGKQYEIRLIESEEIGTVGVGEATIPTLHFMHEILDLDESEFMKATQATFKLGIQFQDWGAPGQAYIHGFGVVGRNTGLVDFHHYWIKQQLRGLAGPLDGGEEVHRGGALIGAAGEDLLEVVAEGPGEGDPLGRSRGLETPSTLASSSYFAAPCE